MALEIGSDIGIATAGRKRSEAARGRGRRTRTASGGGGATGAGPARRPRPAGPVSREPETPPKRRSSLKRTSPSARRSASSGYLRDSYGNEPSPSLGYPAQCPPCPNSSYPMQNGTMPAWNSTLPPLSPVAYPDGSFGAQCGFMEPEFDASSIRYPQGPAMSTPIPRRNPRVAGHMDCPSGGYMETLPEHTMGSAYSQRPSMAHHSMTPLPILRGSRGPPGGPAMNASAAMSAPAMYGRSASSIPGRSVGVSFPPQSPYQGQQFPSQDRPVSTPSGGIVCCNTCCRPAPCCCPTQFCVVDNPCAACADPEYYECGEHIHETPSPMCNYHRYLCERQKSAIAESTAELDNTYLRDCMPMSAPRFDKTKLYADPKGRRLQPSLSCHGLSPSQLQHPVDPQMMSLLYRNKLDKEKTPESTGVLRGGASSFQSAPSNIRTSSSPGTTQNFRSSSPSRTSRIPRKQPAQGTPSIPGTSSRFGTQSNPKTHSSSRPSSNFRTQSNSRIQSMPRTYSISKSQSVSRAPSNAKTPPVPRAASIPMTSSFPGSKSPYLPRNNGSNSYISGNSCPPCPQTGTYPGRTQYSCQTPYNVTSQNVAYSNGSKYTVSNNYPLNQRTRGGRETPTHSSPVSRTSDRSVHVDKTPSSSFRPALQETPTANMAPSGCPSEYTHRPLVKIPIPSYPSVRRVVHVSNKTPTEITISVTPNLRSRTGASVYSDPNIVSGQSTSRPLYLPVPDKSAPNSPEKDGLNTKDSHFSDSTSRAASIHIPPTFQEYRHFPSESCPKMPPLRPNIPSNSIARTSLPPVSLSFPPSSLSNIGFSISVTPTARVSPDVQSDVKSKMKWNSRNHFALNCRMMMAPGIVSPGLRSQNAFHSSMMQPIVQFSILRTRPKLIIFQTYRYF
ncbi:uncharacterized protein [Bemisia tabaci]|uniref:uncharacterized protein isoform X1 n=1 Tax=Bemisia tabaci TaxID=7038 RepID=UPI003B281E69